MRPRKPPQGMASHTLRRKVQGMQASLVRAGTTPLAWLGADVVKIERPGTGDPGRGLLVGGDHSAYFLSWNANKRSVAVALEKPEGRELLLHMLPRYDVFVENFGPGVLEKLGLQNNSEMTVYAIRNGLVGS